MTPDALPAPPALVPMTQIRCEVGALVSLGMAKHGERRYVPLGAGTVQGPELNGTLVEGGVDWQVQRADGVTDIAAHYVIRTRDGALVEVQSEGMRHGPAEVMARQIHTSVQAGGIARRLMRASRAASRWRATNTSSAPSCASPRVRRPGCT